MLQHNSPGDADPVDVLIVFTVTPPRLREILHGMDWKTREVHNLAGVALFFASSRSRVVLCHTSLADGSWKDVLEHLAGLPSPPRLVVTSELTDEYLWAEVLNLGGYDVIAQPFQEAEVVRTLYLALQPKSGGGRNASPKVYPQRKGALRPRARPFPGA